MKKIIHLSDLHIGHEECGKRFRTIISRISKTRLPARNYIIVITGDIADNANHSEYTDEALKGIELLRKRGYRVLVVPGNHDYGNGAAGKKEFVSIFKEKFFGSADITYPKLDIIGRTAFIGLDTTAEELHWYDRFFSEGELGPAQLERLATILDNEKVKSRKKVVYMHHHPFDYKAVMQLKDNDELRNIISGRVDAILFGHYHRDEEAAVKDYNGTWDIPRCYNAGSSTHKNGHTGYQRIIDLSKPDPSKDKDAKFI
ncbi:MAG TPA: metallophosphoesterase [Bacteroidales bacterium]|nr:metallophosphoesterase [Bacteroidales bacterium]